MPVLPSRGGTAGERGGAGLPARRRRPRRRSRPRLDPTQQAVVDHPGGPLLVLAGPGTGKTTTIVEAVATRIEAGLDPEQILVLTFSRKAAAELRTRITGRVARPSASRWRAPALLRLRRPRRAALLRVTAAAAAHLGRAGRRRRRTAPWRRRGGGRGPLAGGPGAGAGARPVPHRAARAAAAGHRARRRPAVAAWGRRAPAGSTGARGAPGAVRAGQRLWTPARGDASGYDPAQLVRQAIAYDGDPEPPRQERSAPAGRSSTRTRTSIRPRSSCCELLAGRRRQPGRRRRSRPVHLRLPRRRAARHRRVPRPFRHTDGRPAGRAAGGLPPLRRGAAADQPARSPRGCPVRGSTAGSAGGDGTDPGPPRCTSSAPPRSRRPTSPTSCAGPTCSTGCRGRRWPSSSAPAAALGRCAARWPPPGSGRGVLRRPAAGRPAGRRAAAQRPHRTAAAAGSGPEPTARRSGWTSRRPRRCWPRRSAGDGARPAPAAPRGGASRWPAGHRRRRAGRAPGDRARRRGAPGAAAEHVAARPAGWPTSLAAGRSRWPATAPPRTCSGRCGSAAAWRSGGRGRARPGGRPAPSPTATSTPSWRCSTPPPASSTGCRRPTCAPSSPTSPRRSCPATPAPPARRRGRRSGC